jgi:RimJ/RimL family protein N-acetyltransferase
VTDGSTLRTERLRLEPIAPGNADELWEASKTSLRELNRWMWWAAEASLASTRAFAEDTERLRREGMSYQFAVRDDGGVAGAMGVDIHGAERRVGEVGYWIRTDRAGRGYATEAGRAVVDFAFAEIGLYRLELRAGVENRASQRVAEKLGFTREGTLRQGCAHGRMGYDCYLYGLLATDPRP